MSNSTFALVVTVSDASVQGSPGAETARGSLGRESKPIRTLKKVTLAKISVPASVSKVYDNAYAVARRASLKAGSAAPSASHGL